MKNKGYINPFEDVHNKARVFRDRVREMNKKDAELHQKQTMKDAAEALGSGTDYSRKRDLS